MKLTIEQAKALKENRLPFYSKNFSGKELVIDSTKRRVSGYAAAFNNVDDDMDVLVKGCFAKSILEHGPESSNPQKIVMLWCHDSKDLIGKVVLLKEDDFGLYFEAELDPIPQADRALIQYGTGSLNQHSIGFRYMFDKCMWGEWKGEHAFICNELKLFELSPVPFGANENTPYTGMKAGQLESEKKLLDRDTEKFINRFEPDKQLELRQIISKHIALGTIMEPGKSHSKDPEPLSRKERNEQLLDYLLTKSNLQ